MRRTCSRGHVFEKGPRCKTCPVCWPGQRKKLLTDNDFPAKLSAPALRALDRAGIHSLFALSKRTETEILDLHSMGPKTLMMLKAALRAIGLKFAKS